MRDKTVQVKLTNKLSSTAIKSSRIDTIQSAIESLDNLLSYAYSSVAIVLLVHKLWINHFKTAEHLNSFVLHCTSTPSPCSPLLQKNPLAHFGPTTPVNSRRPSTVTPDDSAV
jgi:hypothetical protein